jgi:hypothetical protein
MSKFARLDVIYVTASARDTRFTRICVASIRHFYPDAPIKLLIGGPLEAGLAEELVRYWDVGVAEVSRGDWGWGFVKLEPLFGRAGERFMVVDSDTAFSGPVLAAWETSDADFLVDDEQQSEADTHRLYYNWLEAAALDPDARPPQFVFNTGQWFGTAGVLSRQDFAKVMDWSTMPPKSRHPGCFRNGDQGVLNYVLNQKAALEGLAVDKAQIMHWPGFGMEGFTASAVAEKTAPPRVIHWAGYKRARLRDLPGADVLRYFEARYYLRLPMGAARRAMGRLRYPATYWRRSIGDKLSHWRGKVR